LVLLVGAAAAAGVAGWWFDWYRAAPPLPPIELEDCDPEVADAIRQVTEGVRRKPRSVDAWGRLGKVLYAHNMLPAAEQCFAGAERLDAADPRWPYFRGICLTRRDNDAARRHLRRALGRCRNQEDANRVRLRFVELCLQDGETAEAETQLDELEALQSQEEARIRCARGMLAAQRGRWAEARTLLLPLAEHPSARKEVCAQLAMICNRLGEANRAALYARLSARAEEDKGWEDPFLEEAAGLGVGRSSRFQKAREKEHGDDLSEVIDDLRRMIQENTSKDYMTHFALGTNLGKMGRHEEAEQAFQAALALAPRSSRILDTLTHARYCQGVLLRDKGHPEAGRIKLEEALVTARQAVEYGKSDAWCHHRQALVLFELGRFQESLEPARQSVVIRPEVAALQTLLGRVLTELGREQEALEHLRRGVACAHPDDNHPAEMLEKCRARFANKNP
jgi:tetratricopeptide (TPR) repeat protein